MAEISIWIPVASAFAGGGLVGLFDLFRERQNRKAEERRHLRELMFNAAIENWKHNNLTAIELLKVGNKNKVELMPLDSYIVTLIALSDSLLSSALTKENITDKLKDAYEIGRKADQFIKDANR